jgi:hypothetical protein
VEHRDRHGRRGGEMVIVGEQRRAEVDSQGNVERITKGQVVPSSPSGPEQFS